MFWGIVLAGSFLYALDVWYQTDMHGAIERYFSDNRGICTWS